MALFDDDLRVGGAVPPDPLGVLDAQPHAAVGGLAAQGVQAAVAQRAGVLVVVEHGVEHDVALDLEGIPGVALVFLELVPDVDI